MEVCCGEVEASLQMFSGMTTCLKDSLCLTFSSLMRICHYVDHSVSVLLWWYIVLGEDLGHISFHGNFIIFYTAFVVQSVGNVRLFVTSSSLSFTISLSLLRRISIESVMPSNHLILCHHLLLLLLSSFPSINVFPKESALHIRWSKYWSFSFSISPSNAYSGLISLRINWFYFFAVLGTFKGLLQYHSSKA